MTKKYKIDERIKNDFLNEHKALYEVVIQQDKEIKALFDLNAREEDRDARLAGKQAIDLQNNQLKISKQSTAIMRMLSTSCWDLHEKGIDNANELHDLITKIEQKRYELEKKVQPFLDVKKAAGIGATLIGWSSSFLKHLLTISATLGTVKLFGGV